MKNIHIIPTDKPSRLHLIEDFLMITNEYKNSACDTEANIYITSDEEIKIGDWVYCLREGFEPVLKQKVNPIGVNNDEMMKKIILTTDQDLIKYGVQAIDDEFLEWFVNNPSCESVEIERYHGINTSIAEVNAISGDGSLNWEGKSDLRDCKIIIPKEEPKQETLEDIKLEEVFGSDYCEFSVVENKLAILYRNQEQLLKAIKLLSNEK